VVIGQKGSDPEDLEIRKNSKSTFGGQVFGGLRGVEKGIEGVGIRVSG